MKYRLIASALVIAVLVALHVAGGDSSTPQQQSAPVPSSDDRALKSLSIN